MPRKGLRVTAEVNIQAVTCPGVRLPIEHDVFLGICFLGFHVHTKSVAPIFPLLIKEKIKFSKTFPCCSDVQQLDAALREETVVLELVKDDTICDKMVVLAIYETCAQNFLFPQPSLRPCYSSADTEVIMEPTNDFPGVIGPKVEYCSMTTIKETCRPELDCLNDKVCKVDDCKMYCRKSVTCLPPCPPLCSPICPPPCSSPCPAPCSSPRLSSCCPDPCKSSFCSDPCKPSFCSDTCKSSFCPDPCCRSLSPKPAMEFGNYSRECSSALQCRPLNSTTNELQYCNGCSTRLRSCSPVPRCSSPRLPRTSFRVESCSSDEDSDNDNCLSFNRSKISSVGCGSCGRCTSPFSNRKRYVHVDRTCGRLLSKCSGSRC